MKTLVLPQRTMQRPSMAPFQVGEYPRNNTYDIVHYNLEGLVDTASRVTVGVWSEVEERVRYVGKTYHQCGPKPPAHSKL